MDSEITGKKISILIVANEIFPDTHGGVHTYVYEVAGGLAKLGHNVSILTKRVSEDLPSLEHINSIRIYRYKNKTYKLAFLGQIANIINIKKEFIRLVEKNNFDIISMHSPHVSFGVNLCKGAKNIPKVYTFYSLLAEEELSSAHCKAYKWYSWRKYIKPIWFSIYLLFSHWLEKKALDNAEKIITLSEFTAKRLMEVHKIPENKIIKIAAGVNTEKFKPSKDKQAVRKALGLPMDKLVLFTVRRLVPRMGLDNLIQAMPIILMKLPNAFLAIGGEGPLYSQLDSLVDRLKLKEKIILTGFISDEKLPLYYQASDLFILPSKELEGFGIVTLEALSSGLPVLATPIGGSVDILSKFNKGLLFKDVSFEAIASLIIEYLADGQKRARIQQECRQFILENYSWDKLTRQIEKLFLEISG